MNLKNITIAVGLAILAFACKSGQESDPAETITHSDVKVTFPIEKDTSVYTEYQGITQFTQHLQIRAQSTGIVSKSLVFVSSRIEKNYPLFVINRSGFSPAGRFCPGR